MPDQFTTLRSKGERHIETYSGISSTCQILSPCIFRTGSLFKTLWNVHQAYSESWNVETWYTRRMFTVIYIKENLQIFRTLTCLKPDTYLKPSQSFKIEFFTKIVEKKLQKNFPKISILDLWFEFWIRLSLNKYSYEYVEWPHAIIIWYIFRTPSIIVNSDIFRHIHILLRYIQPYWGIFRTLCNSCMFRTLPY